METPKTIIAAAAGLGLGYLLFSRKPPAIDTLFFLGRGPPREDPQENITIHLKLAMLERTKRKKKVEVILMHDAAWWAAKDSKYAGLKAAAPDDDMTVKQDP